MAQTDIVFFDLASTLPVPISPNTNKVRLALNLKGVRYTTHWVPFSQVEAKLKSFGIPPSSKRRDGGPQYTVPAIIDRTDPANVVCLSDSTPIIEYLEKTYPTPGVDLIPKQAAPLLHFFEQYLLKELIHPTYFNLLISGACSAVGEPGSEDQRAYAERFVKAIGKRPDEIEKPDGTPEREQAIKTLEGTFDTIAQVYDKSGGLFIVPGDKPTIVDLRMASTLLWLRTIRKEEVWEKVEKWHGGRWARFLEYFESYSALEGQ